MRLKNDWYELKKTTGMKRKGILINGWTTTAILK